MPSGKIQTDWTCSAITDLRAVLSLCLKFSIQWFHQGKTPNALRVAIALNNKNG
ncbi:hypothetical protein IWQ55_000570 [Labrenzia sp. EL_208]|uniref:Uncharacterized protein n=1 Tax=Roseibium album TaxID=311410 RepID=A0A0M7AK04_9HYPH|nr:hypothetical protein [Labrenzia sp. EL_142]MBG6157156.1 hypothetical protein [Labrenzia sp. EL_162]MBG6166397.1 hypothetical protein [Labrenzia sp. EL_195]MBG6172404.1 hypothetical protein [Labrenzia sp. EL_132]MBG6194903.1 hypothetical protein [Labrenzia sp. EL_159]MBG6203515.1 hypothetical protein [Labrenzia sp. EL_13]MBG6227378.1 hypothetical protein [Labrenzia sp. EL_208]CTQ59353.1 hypothetical protein LA5094_02120 [Roseibium album]